MPDTEDETREMFESVYRDFNARDIDAILLKMTEDVEHHSRIRCSMGRLQRWAVAAQG